MAGAMRLLPFFVLKKTKKSKKKFAKPIDITHNVCYNIYNKRKTPYKANRRKRERKMKITVVNTNMREVGKRDVHKKASRKDLERTLLDILTMDDGVNFCDAQEIVEDIATYDELIEMIWELENEKTTAQKIIKKYEY